MEVKTDFTYRQLRSELAKALKRSDIPSGTLSRWMAELGYPRGQPGQRRRWDEDDLAYLAGYAKALSLKYSGEDAQDYARRSLLKFREERNHARYR